MCMEQKKKVCGKWLWINASKCSWNRKVVFLCLFSEFLGVFDSPQQEEAMVMEERNHETGAAPKCCCCGWGPFVVGLVVALILGWYVLPDLMVKEQKQPIAFSHVVHVNEQGMACSDCHYMRADGTFNGLPSTESCASCHADVMGENPEEARFVKNYVATGREIKHEWLVYQKQPDNVFFSHAVHSEKNCGGCHSFFRANPTQLCGKCHPAVWNTDTPLVYKENRLSGYSVHTMMMPQCEECHAFPAHLAKYTRANNACSVCHK